LKQRLGPNKRQVAYFDSGKWERERVLLVSTMETCTIFILFLSRLWRFLFYFCLNLWPFLFYFCLIS